MERIFINTQQHTEIIDLTRELKTLVARLNFRDGIIHLFVPHTTAGVAINERIDPELVTDLENAFNRVVGDDWEWRHDDEDGPNAPSHARASLASSPQVLIPLRDGSLALGTYPELHNWMADYREVARVGLTVIYRRQPLLAQPAGNTLSEKR